MSALGNLAFVLLGCLAVAMSVVSMVSVVAVSVSVVVSMSVSVSVVVLLSSNGLGSLVIVTLGGVPVLGRGTILVSVLAPSLGSPLVVVLVVPFVIGLGVVGLGPCAVIRLLDAQVLVSAPSIPVGAGLATVTGVGGLRGAVPLAALLHTVGVATVATLAKAAVGVAEVAGVLLGPLGGLLAAGVGVTGVVSVVVLSPLVIISLNGSGVALVVVRLGGDGIVGFAPSGVEVGAVSLLGPLVIVVGTACSLGVVGGAAPVAVHLTVASGLWCVTTIATMTTVALAGNSAASTLPVLGGRSLAVGGGAIDVSIFAPGLSAPFVIVFVVPFVVRLGRVGLGLHLVVGDVLLVVLIASPGVPIGARFAPVASAAGSGGGLGVTASLLAPAVAAVVLPDRTGGGLAVGISVASIVLVVILGPLVVVGSHRACVPFAVVGLGIDGVVRLAPS